ncbi:MAG: hypothetical protein ACOCSD_06545, partial [Halolamina sp.]
VVSRAGSGPFSRVGELVAREFGLLRLARRVRPDVVVSQVDPAAIHVARFVGARSVVFDDSEPERFAAALTHQFADVVCTPASFDRDVPNQRRYDGFHELAYLHPKRFEPDPAALERHGVDPDAPYSVVRFVGWDAHHDIGRQGFSRSGKRRLVDALAAFGAVYVSSESPLPPDLAEYAVPVSVDAMHDLLAYADCYVGDSQTMATEAAVLGTPAVRTNAFVGDDDMSNFRELEANYGLLRSFRHESDAIACAVAYAQSPPHVTLARRRERLLAEKTDVTAFLLDVIEEQAVAAGVLSGTETSTVQQETATAQRKTASTMAPVREAQPVAPTGQSRHTQPDRPPTDDGQPPEVESTDR